VIDYVVWCPGRCGSILTSNIILAALYKQNLDLLYYNGQNLYYDGPAKVIHSHNPWFFINSNVSCRKIALTRNLFESTLSHAIMLHTGMGHIVESSQVEEYRSRFSNHKFTISPTAFLRQIKKMDNEYTTVFSSDADYITVSYEDIKHNPFNVIKLSQIDKRLIDIQSLGQHNISKKIPIEKSQIVENFHELKEIYNDTQLKNKSLT
jgi:hypothetical protein